MSKKVKTVDELRQKLAAARAEYEARLKAEREEIGAAVQAATGLDSWTEIERIYELKKREREA